MKIASIKRDFIFAGLTNISDVFLFGIMVLAGRMLGADDFGALSYAQSLATIFFIFTCFGLEYLIIRDVGRNREIAIKYLPNTLLWKLLLTLAVFVIYIYVVIYIHESTYELRVVFISIGIAVMLKFFSMLGRSFLQAIQRFDIESIVAVSEQGFLFIVGSIILFLGGGLLGLVFCFIASRLIGCLLTYIVLFKQIDFIFNFSLKFTYRLQLQALPIGIAFLAKTAYLHIDNLFLTNYVTYYSLGNYNAAYKIYVGLFLFPSIICTILFPRLSRAFYNNKKEYKRLVKKGTLALLIFAMVFAFTGMAFSEKIIQIVYGDNFFEAAMTIKILLCVTIITFQILFLRILLISKNQQKALMVFNIAGLGIRIIFDLWLIPVYGINGAAIATGLSEIVLFTIICLFLTFKYLKNNNLFNFVYRIKRNSIP